MAKYFHIVGAGGFGRELLAWILGTPEVSGGLEFAGFLDDNPPAAGDFGPRFRVVGSIAGHIPNPDAVYFMGIGSPGTRLAVGRELRAHGAVFPVLKHPLATVGLDCVFGDGCILCPGSVITSHATLGDFVLVNLCATIGHDARVGDGCTLSSHTDVTGGVVLEEGVLLGSHASILPGAKVGANSLVGAGSVVLRSVKAGTTVMGVPAKPISPESDERKASSPSASAPHASEAVPVVIVGAAGHGQVLADALRATGRFHVVGFLDDGVAPGTCVAPGRVLGGLATLPELLSQTPSLRVVIGIGDNVSRRRCVEKIRAMSPDVVFPAVIHPSAVIAPDVEIGEGVVVLAGVVVSTGAVLGAFSLLNTRASLDHHSVLGDYASLAPGAMTGGNVRIGAGAAVGMGASILQGRFVGADSVVGAMSLVYHNIPDRVVVHGTPARHRAARDFSKPYLSPPGSAR